MSTGGGLTTLTRLNSLCWVGVLLASMAGAAEPTEQPVDPALLLFIASFSDHGRWLDPVAIDAAMAMTDAATALSDEASQQPAASDDGGAPEHSNDFDEEQRNEQH